MIATIRQAIARRRLRSAPEEHRCTCHSSERFTPCQRRYAFSECKAAHALQRIRDANYNAPATVEYRKRRQAALKHTRGTAL